MRFHAVKSIAATEAEKKNRLFRQPRRRDLEKRACSMFDRRERRMKNLAGRLKNATQLPDP